MPSISVIIPVYNAADHITRCMDSLRAQTFRHFEVLFVDDAGTDDSLARVRAYIKEYALQAAWHIIPTTCNTGPGPARNRGIDAAQGTYIAFLDADDWIEPTMLADLYDLAVRHQADLVTSAATADYPDGSSRLMPNPHVGSGPLTPDARRHLLRHFVSNFTTMLFRRDYLITNHLHFPATTASEDSAFVAMCYLTATRIAQTTTPYYHYIIHPASLSHTPRTFRGPAKRQAFRAVLRYARAHGLLRPYRTTLYYIYLKKALLFPIIDYLRSL